MDRVLLLDTDLVMLDGALEALWSQFQQFTTDAMLAVARAQSPAYERALGASVGCWCGRPLSLGALCGSLWTGRGPQLGARALPKGTEKGSE